MSSKRARSPKRGKTNEPEDDQIEDGIADLDDVMDGVKTPQKDPTKKRRNSKPRQLKAYGKKSPKIYLKSLEEEPRSAFAQRQAMIAHHAQDSAMSASGKRSRAERKPCTNARFELSTTHSLSSTQDSPPSRPGLQGGPSGRKRRPRLPEGDDFRTKRGKRNVNGPNSNVIDVDDNKDHVSMNSQVSQTGARSFTESDDQRDSKYRPSMIILLDKSGNTMYAAASCEEPTATVIRGVPRNPWIRATESLFESHLAWSQISEFEVIPCVRARYMDIAAAIVHDVPQTFHGLGDMSTKNKGQLRMLVIVLKCPVQVAAFPETSVTTFHCKMFSIVGSKRLIQHLHDLLKREEVKVLHWREEDPSTLVSKKEKNSLVECIKFAGEFYKQRGMQSAAYLPRSILNEFWRHKKIPDYFPKVSSEDREDNPVPKTRSMTKIATNNGSRNSGGYTICKGKLKKTGSAPLGGERGARATRKSLYRWDSSSDARSCGSRKKSVNEVLTLEDDDGEEGRFGRVTRSRAKENREFTFGEGELQDIYFTYPVLMDKYKISVTKEDAQRTEEGVFLNDIIIDFYIRYLLDKWPEAKSHMHEKVYAYSSLFVKRMFDVSKRKWRHDKESNEVDANEALFDWTRRWGRKVDLFQKETLIFPINDALHWSVVVVLNAHQIPAYVQNEQIRQQNMFTAQTVESQDLEPRSTAGDSVADDTASGHAFGETDADSNGKNVATDERSPDTNGVERSWTKRGLRRPRSSSSSSSSSSTSSSSSLSSKARAGGNKQKQKTHTESKSTKFQHDEQMGDDSGDNGYETCLSQSQVKNSEHRGDEDSKEARHSSTSRVSSTKTAKRGGKGASASGNARRSCGRVNGDEEAQLPKTGVEIKDEGREAASTQAMTETRAGINLLPAASHPPAFFSSYGKTSDSENPLKEKTGAKRRRNSVASRDERDKVVIDNEDDDPIILDSTAEGGGGTKSQMNQDTEMQEQEHTVSLDAHAETRSEDEKAVSAKQEGKSSKYFASMIESIASGTEKDDENMTSAHASDAPISRTRQASSSVSSATSPLPQSRATSPVGSPYWKPFAKYDPRKKPQVLFMDSLGSHRKKKVITVIETYLQNIFRDRAPKTEGFESNEDDVAALAMTFDNLPSRQLDVTTQPNYYDCGVFVVRYVEEVLRTKYKSCSEDKVTNEEVIDAVRALTWGEFEHVRRDMRRLMKDLHAQYEELLAHKAQEQGAEEESTDEVEAEEIKKDDAGPGAEATKEEPRIDDRDAAASRKDDVEERGNADPGTISHEEDDAEVADARNPDDATMQVGTKKKEEEQEEEQQQEEEGAMLDNDTKGDSNAQIDAKRKMKMKNESAAVVKSESDEESAVEAMENKNGSKSKASARIDVDADVESDKEEGNADVEEIHETNNNADAEFLKDENGFDVKEIKENNDDADMEVEEVHVAKEKVRTMGGAEHELKEEDPIEVAKRFAEHNKGKEGCSKKQPRKVEEGDEEDDDLKDEASKISFKTRSQPQKWPQTVRDKKESKEAVQTESDDVEVITLS